MIAIAQLESFARVGEASAEGSQSLLTSVCGGKSGGVAGDDQVAAPFDDRALWENDKARTAREAMTPLRRLGEPGEIGGIAVFLASRAGSFITGQTIVADGGVTIA